MTPDTFMSISQQSKPKSSPNKLGWKAAFDPLPTIVTSALQLDCFQLRFLWVASLQATTENAGTGFTWDLRTTKLVHEKKKKLLAKPNRQLFSAQLQSSSSSCCDTLWQKLRTSCPLGPISSVVSHHSRLYVKAATAHIPSDHSCVWHFKEDYENEMW